MPRKRVGAVAVSAAIALSSCAAGGTRRAAPAPSTSPPPPATTTTTVPPTTAPPTTVAPTTTTTVDPGSLPQTSVLPSAQDPQFAARLSDLLQAVASGQPGLAAPAFFPLGAYIQVKGISDPVHDYQTRLIPDFDQDILALHSEIDPGAATVTFESVTVPDAAQWIRPGVEYNKGSYWRVYDSRLNFRVAGQLHYFTIVSLISWRGEWYVVHLSSIR
ncbi:MAG TPA: hypothetical protein VFH58_06785 [Acidimicrobiales bacterium]|nr:hypothetical protein [Acidimicrobiales bacterium]